MHVSSRLLLHTNIYTVVMNDIYKLHILFILAKFLLVRPILYYILYAAQIIVIIVYTIYSFFIQVFVKFVAICVSHKYPHQIRAHPSHSSLFIIIR